MEDIVATQRVETRRVAVGSTVWLDGRIITGVFWGIVGR